MTRQNNTPAIGQVKERFYSLFASRSIIQPSGTFIAFTHLSFITTPFSLSFIPLPSGNSPWLCLGNLTPITIKPGDLRDEHVTHAGQSQHFKSLVTGSGIGMWPKPDGWEFNTGLPTCEKFLCYRMTDNLENQLQDILEPGWIAEQLGESLVSRMSFHSEKKACLRMESTQKKGRIESWRGKKCILRTLFDFLYPKRPQTRISLNI